jgi:putative serine protease PepD
MTENDQTGQPEQAEQQPSIWQREPQTPPQPMPPADEPTVQQPIADTPTAQAPTVGLPGAAAESTDTLTTQPSASPSWASPTLESPTPESATPGSERPGSEMHGPATPGVPAPSSAAPASGAPFSGPPASGVPAVTPQTPVMPPYQSPWPPQQPSWQGGAPGPYGPQPTYGMPMPGGPGGPGQPGSGRPGGSGRVGRYIGAGLLALLLAGGGGAIGGLIVHAADSSSIASNSATPASNHPAAPVINRSSLADIVASVKDSVVSIQTQDAEGSGVIISADGFILTNNHVVADAQGNTVQVTFSNGKNVKATIVGTDPKTDLAVVKAQGVSGLSPANFGDSGALQVGDTVLAIGSPLGLQGSVTEGIVSALNRTIDESGNQQQNPLGQQQQQAGTSIAGAIQTDAAINPGNSGGALVNTNGEVVGINTAIATASNTSEGNIGVGFAIPSNKAKEVAQALMKGQKVSHPYLGIGVGDADNNGGASVASVVSGSPADKAGVKQGDVITKAGNTDIHNSDDLLNVVQSSKVGDKLTLTVNRGGSTQTITVTVGESS